MRKGTLGVVMAMGLLAVSAGAVRAETNAPAATDHEIRVVNRNGTTMRVYVQSADGGLYLLGRVAAADFKVLKVPAAVAAKGTVQIKVFPVPPMHALTPAVDGIESGKIELSGHDALNMYVECQLKHSIVEIAKG